MWQKIAEKTWDFFLWLDRKHIKKFDYETAPYCGHHHCGHDGKYTETHYHEGDGGGNNKRLLWLIHISYNNLDRCRYQLVIFPPIFRAFIWVKTLRKRTLIMSKTYKNDTINGYRKGTFVSFQYNEGQLP